MALAVDMVALHAALVSHWLLQVLTRHTSRSKKPSSLHCLSASVVASRDALAGSAALDAAGAGAAPADVLAVGAVAALALGAAPVLWLSSAAIKLTSLSAAVAVLTGLLLGAASGDLAAPTPATALAGAGVALAAAGCSGALAGVAETSAFSMAAGGGLTPSSRAEVILLSAFTTAGFAGAGSLMICAAASGATAAMVTLASLAVLGNAATLGDDLNASSAFSSMMTVALAVGLLGCWLANMY